MTSKTKRAPWFGLEATSREVVGCDHRWVIVRVGDVMKSCYDPDERMVFCARCYAPRCGWTGDEDPCVLPRHHREHHCYESGKSEPIGGW